VARALRAERPLEALAAGARDGRLPAALRRALLAALRYEDGVRMTALLVKKLRFERIIRGHAAAGAWFDADPRGFVAAFRAYDRAHPPLTPWPAAEARRFLAWSRGRSRAGKVGRQGPGSRSGGP
jgi:hypothetical protein